MAELEIMATGVGIVMGVLALLWGMTALIGAVVKGAGRVANRARRRPAAGSGIPPHHLAVIAAAAAEMIQAPHRIVRVSAPAHRTAGWIGQGRVRHLPGGWPVYQAADRGRT